MFNTNNFKTLFLSVILLFVSACEDDHDHDHDGDGDNHTEAYGFMITDSSGSEVWKELNGALITDTGLMGHVDHETEYMVQFLDADGDVIVGDDHDDHDHGDHDDHGDDEPYLEFSGYDNNIAVIATEDEDHDDHDEAHCEDFTTEADCGMHDECEWHADDMACEDADHDHEEHSDEEGMHFHLLGMGVGNTTFTLSLMHQGHSDYTSTNLISVQVTAPTN